MGMLMLYLDNNVYDHMLRGYGDAAELRRLLVRPNRRTNVVAILSLTNLSECLPVVSQSPSALTERIRLIRDIVDWDYILKPVPQLLRDDVRHFARFGSGTSAFATEGTTVRNLMKHALKALPRASPQDLVELGEIAGELMKERADFEKFMDHARQPVQEIIGRSRMQFRDFEATWNFCFQDQGSIDRLLGGHARTAGKLEQCARRGLTKMLDVPSVRMAAGYSLAFIFWLAFRRREASSSDVGDLRHSINCSAANVFVCADGFLRKLLTPIPGRQVEILSICETVSKLKAV